MSEIITHSHNRDTNRSEQNSEHCFSNSGLPHKTEAGKKTRGRIPRGAWGYVLGLYDQANETLKMIGDRYGVEPSAVHYVLRQARKKNIEPTLTPPSRDVMATPRRLIDGRACDPAGGKHDTANDSPMANGTTSHTSSMQSAPEVDSAMARAINSPLAKRVMDTSAELINSILHYEKDPSQNNRYQLDEARRSGLRAMAAIELWMHQVAAATSNAQPRQQQSQSSNPAYQVQQEDERLSEMA